MTKTKTPKEKQAAALDCAARLARGEAALVALSATLESQIEQHARLQFQHKERIAAHATGGDDYPAETRDQIGRDLAAAAAKIEATRVEVDALNAALPELRRQVESEFLEAQRLGLEPLSDAVRTEAQAIIDLIEGVRQAIPRYRAAMSRYTLGRGTVRKAWLRSELGTPPGMFAPGIDEQALWGALVMLADHFNAGKVTPPKINYQRIGVRPSKLTDPQEVAPIGDTNPN